MMQATSSPQNFHIVEDEVPDRPKTQEDPSVGVSLLAKLVRQAADLAQERADLFDDRQDLINEVRNDLDTVKGHLRRWEERLEAREKKLDEREARLDARDEKLRVEDRARGQEADRHMDTVMQCIRQSRSRVSDMGAQIAASDAQLVQLLLNRETRHQKRASDKSASACSGTSPGIPDGIHGPSAPMLESKQVANDATSTFKCVFY